MSSGEKDPKTIELKFLRKQKKSVYRVQSH